MAVHAAGVMAEDMTASADLPSGMASRAIPSRVCTPSVSNPPLSTDAPWTDLEFGTVEGTIWAGAKALT